MKKQLKLSVKNPCSKKFEHFRPTQHGGFCSSCAKEVIDFTAMTDQEIVHYTTKTTKIHVVIQISASVPSCSHTSQNWFPHLE